jgi:PAS domain S-box-containing protein
MEAPGDPRSFRLVYSNAASAELTGLDVGEEVGRLLVEVVPGIVETDVLDRYAEVVRTGRPADLGLVTYGDERVAERTYQIHASPLPDGAVGVVFEDVTDRAELAALHEARDAVERNEARYRSLVEATAAIVWTTPPGGVFAEDQPGWRAVTGQTAAELMGEGWLDAVHPDDRAHTARAWREALGARAVYETEHRLRSSDGSYRRMQVRAAPVLDDAGDVVEWVGVHTDVEAQRSAAAELAASEARFRTLFDAIDDVVLVYPLGPGGPEPFVTFNAAAVARYGYAADELGRMTVEDLVDPGRINVANALDELRRSRRATYESTHVTKDGRRVPVETSATLAEVDGRLCVVALCRDDSERRQFRRQLSRANLGLERSVAERTAQLEAFAEDLKILHALTTAEHATPEARIDAYLRAGCEMFDLPVGILAATPRDPATGRRLYRLEAVVSPDPDLAPGLTVPLSEAFCDAVVERGETVAYADAEAEAPDHPACAQRGLRAFLGTPIWAEGELFGTLNFVSPEPRPDGFATNERELIEVMAEAVARRLRLDRAEDEQAEAEEWYRSIVETVDGGVIVVDADCEIVLSNPSAQSYLGLDDDRAGAETDDLPDRWPVLDAGGRPVSAADLPEREALRTGRPVRGVLHGIARPGGPVRWYRVNATPVDRDSDGRPEHVVVSFSDVTDLRAAAEEAREAAALLRAVQAAAPEGVMAFRAVRGAAGAVEDFEWVLANPLAAAISGRPGESLVGRRLLEEFPGNAASGLFDAYVRVTETGEPYRTTVRYEHDGLATTFRLRASALDLNEDGAPDGFVVVFTEAEGAGGAPTRAAA